MWTGTPLSTTAQIFIYSFHAENKHCMFIHCIQPPDQSSPDDSFFLPKYHIRDHDEKGESSIPQWVLRKWQGAVLKMCQLYRITKALF